MQFPDPAVIQFWKPGVAFYAHVYNKHTRIRCGVFFFRELLLNVIKLLSDILQKDTNFIIELLLL